MNRHALHVHVVADCIPCCPGVLCVPQCVAIPCEVTVETCS